MYSYALVYCFDERCGQNYSNWPGLFFFFLSGLGHFLAKRCTHLHFFLTLPSTIHREVSPSSSRSHSFFPPVLFLLSLSLHVAFCCAVSAPFSPSHCPITRCRIRDCDAFSIIFAADDLTTLWSTRWNIDLSHIVIFGSRVVVRQEGETREEARCWSMK